MRCSVPGTWATKPSLDTRNTLGDGCGRSVKPCNRTWLLQPRETTISTLVLGISLVGAGRGMKRGASGITYSWEGEKRICARSTPEARADRARREMPLGRTGRPEDIAESFYVLVGPESGYMTGQTVHVNGGIVMV